MYTETKGRKGDLVMKKSVLTLHVSRSVEGIDVELPLQVRAHLSFHLIDLSESEHALACDTP